MRSYLVAVVFLLRPPDYAQDRSISAGVVRISLEAAHDIAPPEARPANVASSIRTDPGQYHRATTAPTTARASGSTNTHKAAAAKRHPVKILSPAAGIGLSAEHCEHPA